VRQIARGISSLLLAGFGVVEALRAQATPASIDVSLKGTAPRSRDNAEAGVYFSCPEAIQNVARHAGRNAQLMLRLHHDHGTLAVRLKNDGHGFDPAHTPDGAGLRDIHQFILMLNSWWEPLQFTVPDPLQDLGWRVEIDTDHPDAAGREVDASAPVTLTGRSLLLLHGTQPAS